MKQTPFCARNIASLRATCRRLDEALSVSYSGDVLPAIPLTFACRTLGDRGWRFSMLACMPRCTPCKQQRNRIEIDRLVRFFERQHAAGDYQAATKQGRSSPVNPVHGYLAKSHDGVGCKKDQPCSSSRCFRHPSHYSCRCGFASPKRARARSGSHEAIRTESSSSCKCFTMRRPTNPDARTRGRSPVLSQYDFYPYHALSYQMGLEDHPSLIDRSHQTRCRAIR